MQNSIALIKREFWENKGAFIITPLVMAALLIIFMLVGLAFFDTIEEARSLDLSVDLSYQESSRNQNGESERHVIIKFDDDNVTVVETDEEDLISPYQANKKNIGDGFWALHAIFMFTAMLVVMFYLLGTLFTDRKDKSILFWKSTPVSETQTVLVKLFVGVIAVPIAYTLASWAVQIFYSIAAMIFASFLDHDPWMAIWPYLDIPKVFLQQLILIVVATILVLPASSWLMAASAFAKRSPFLVATVPVVSVITAEALLFKSSYFANWFAENVLVNDELDISLGLDLSTILAFGTLVNLAISAGLISIAIWLRNYRFEI